VNTRGQPGLLKGPLWRVLKPPKYRVGEGEMYLTVKKCTDEVRKVHGNFCPGWLGRATCGGDKGLGEKLRGIFFVLSTRRAKGLGALLNGVRHKS